MKNIFFLFGFICVCLNCYTGKEIFGTYALILLVGFGIIKTLKK